MRQSHVLLKSQQPVPCACMQTVLLAKKKIENTVQAFCKLKIDSMILGKRNGILRNTAGAHLYYNTSKGTLKNSLIFIFSG